MLRKQFVKKNIHTNEIKYIIGHNGSIYIGITFNTLVVLFFLYILYYIIGIYINFSYLSFLFGVFGIIIFIKYVVDFLNLYLDCLVLSPEGITLFMREGLVEYKTELFDWSKIVTINHKQKGLWDKIFYRGDLFINLEQGIEFPFENITQPKKQVDKIINMRIFYLNRNLKLLDKTAEVSKNHTDSLLTQNDMDEDKLKIFLEAFGEVMKEYVKK